MLKGEKMKRPTIYVAFIFGLVVCIGIGIYYFSNYSNKYFINNSNKDIEEAIEERIKTDISIRASTVTDDKLHFIFTIGETVGSGELSRGWNNKYKLEFFGHGTNWIRERIVKTKSGQYLKLAGRNDENIGSIKAFIDEEEYYIKIPEDKYYIVMTPVKETDREFTSAMIVYDREGKEIERINIPSK